MGNKITKIERDRENLKDKYGRVKFDFNIYIKNKDDNYKIKITYMYKDELYAKYFKNVNLIKEVEKDLKDLARNNNNYFLAFNYEDEEKELLNATKVLSTRMNILNGINDRAIVKKDKYKLEIEMETKRAFSHLETKVIIYKFTKNGWDLFLEDINYLYEGKNLETTENNVDTFGLNHYDEGNYLQKEAKKLSMRVLKKHTNTCKVFSF